MQTPLQYPYEIINILGLFEKKNKILIENFVVNDKTSKSVFELINTVHEYIHSTCSKTDLLFGCSSTTLRDTLSSAAAIFLLKSIEENEIYFTSIDDVCIAKINEEGSGSENDKFILETIPLRDKIMADAYLTAKQSVLGRVGATHLIGMQNNIFKELSTKCCLNYFKFIFIYSHDDSDALYKQLLAMNLPFGIIGFDNRIKKDDEIITEILDFVRQNQKTELLNHYVKTDGFFAIKSETQNQAIKNLNTIYPK